MTSVYQTLTRQILNNVFKYLSAAPSIFKNNEQWTILDVVLEENLPRENESP